MLVLTRKRNERIILGNGTTITLVSIIGDKVRIGIDAPPDVTVHREEVARAIEASGQDPQERRKRTR